MTDKNENLWRNGRVSLSFSTKLKKFTDIANSSNLRIYDPTFEKKKE